MTTKDYRRACDLAEVIIEQIPLPDADWEAIGTAAFRLGKIALIETLRIERDQGDCSSC